MDWNQTSGDEWAPKHFLQNKNIKKQTKTPGVYLNIFSNTKYLQSIKGLKPWRKGRYLSLQKVKERDSEMLYHQGQLQWFYLKFYSISSFCSLPCIVLAKSHSILFYSSSTSTIHIFEKNSTYILICYLLLICNLAQL